jgi:predicted nucleic acid-binding protein
VSTPQVVLDAGVLDRATTDQEFRWVLRELVDSGWDPVIPTVVLAEALTGRPGDAPTNQLVRRLGTADTSQAIARRAGRLRHDVRRSGARRVPSGIDAIVAAHAAERETGVVFTTDPADLRRLLAELPRIAVERP